MTKLIKNIAPVLVLVGILLMPCFTLASQGDLVSKKLKNVAKDGGYNTANKNALSLPAQVGKVISVLLGLLGIIFLGLIVYAGTLWMIAAGNEDKVTRSKDTMRRAIIGLVIVVGAYAISQYVVFLLIS